MKPQFILAAIVDFNVNIFSLLQGFQPEARTVKSIYVAPTKLVF